MNNPISSQTNPVIVIFAVIGLLTAFVFAYWGFGLKNSTYQGEYNQAYQNDDLDFSNDLLRDGDLEDRTEIPSPAMTSGTTQ